MMQSIQTNFEKEDQDWRTYTICFSDVLKIFNHEASMDFGKEEETQVKKHRSLEEKREPRNRFTHAYMPN